MKQHLQVGQEQLPMLSLDVDWLTPTQIATLNQLETTLKVFVRIIENLSEQSNILLNKYLKDFIGGIFKENSLPKDCSLYWERDGNTRAYVITIPTPTGNRLHLTLDI